MNRKITLGVLAVFILAGSFFSLDLLNKYCGEKYFNKIETDAPQSVIIKKGENQKKKNKHVRTNVTYAGNSYKITYSFKDHTEKLRTIDLLYDKTKTDEQIRKFGIASSFLRGVKNTQANKELLDRQLKSGMYLMEEGKLTPDYNAMIQYYKPYAKPIADFIDKALGKNADINSKVEFALRFCQDIPYCKPPVTFNGKVTAGLFSPPHTLVNMYSDCDSKSLLLACILKHFQCPELVLVHVPGHMLMGMEGVPSTYQKSFKYKNKTYLFLEPTGPLRCGIGESRKKYRTGKNIIPID